MRTTRLSAAVLTALLLLAAACGGAEPAASTTADDPAVEADATTAADTADAPAADGEPLSGSIEIDGSSTVVPLTDAVAEDYAAEESGVTVNVGFSGTGGGFQRFCADETDISNASRPIKDEEVQACDEAGIDYTEIRVATDALTVVTATGTDWVDCLTVEELETIWRPEDPAQTWADVRDGFPDTRIDLYAPGADSGTYDFFNEEVLGSDVQPRQDANFQEDDNILVRGVSGTVGSLGYFGYSYFEENAGTLKALAIDGGDGCVEPSVETAMDGTYEPLSRPLFIYVKNSSLQRPEVADFVQFYLDNVQVIAEDVLFIPPTDDQLVEAQDALDAQLG